MDVAFINDIGRYRRYKFDSVRDLLRVIRNKLNHYRELSKEIQAILGPVPEGFYSYFSTRFPKLLIEVYQVFLSHCAEEETFHKYFRIYPIPYLEYHTNLIIGESCHRNHSNDPDQVSVLSDYDQYSISGRDYLNDQYQVSTQVV
ncbi:UNVERIFIED_CONTAM: Serine/threonine-protein kinase/endoribonuclease IRE1a [Sesamum latifolium]|uniref:Serine/threonine-protein kinase/endoribonuclease IRE1a n=1 Tax=Sesamum latifolium TaxID=2727402 RepID=A0AAW2WFC6_9LAMI